MSRLSLSTLKQPFYGWYVVAAGSGIQFLAAAILQQTFGAYAAELTREFGWSRGTISIAFSMSRVESGILGPLQGWMIHRFGPRNIVRAGLIVMALGFLLFSQINSLPVFFVAFGMMAIGGSLAGFMAIQVTIVNWFDRFRARALGISQVGFSIGGLAAPIAILAITRLGWRETAIASAFIVLAFGLPMTKYLYDSAEQMGYRIDGLTEEEESALREQDRAAHRESSSTTVDFTTREALRTHAFWMVSLGHASALLVVGAVMAHIYLHLTGSRGYSDVVASAFIFLMTAAQIVGQLVGGYLGDRINKRTIVVVCMGMHGVALLLVAYIDAVWAVTAFAMLHGSAWGARGPLMNAIRADYFGRSSFGMIIGFSSLITMCGIMAGPLVAGFLYDRTGSYTAGFTAVAVLAVCGSIFFVLAGRPPLPNRAGTAQVEAVTAL